MSIANVLKVNSVNVLWLCDAMLCHEFGSILDQMTPSHHLIQYRLISSKKLANTHIKMLTPNPGISFTKVYLSKCILKNNFSLEPKVKLPDFDCWFVFNMTGYPQVAFLATYSRMLFWTINCECAWIIRDNELYQQCFKIGVKWTSRLPPFGLHFINTEQLYMHIFYFGCTY